MMTHQLPKTLKWCQLLMSFIIFWCFSFSWSYFYLFFCLYFFCLFVWSLCILTHRSRSQSADSGNMYMMNWAATPAAQVPPHVHGDTTRGELLCRVVIYDTLLCMHMWTVCIAWSGQTPSQLHQMYFHNALFVTSGHSRTHIDLIYGKSMYTWRATVGCRLF